MTRKQFTLISIAAITFVTIAAQTVIGVWPQTNGDTCYTWFSALFCTEGDSLSSATLPPVITATPVPSSTKSTSTPTRTPTLLPASPTPSRTLIPPTQSPVVLVNGNFEQTWTTGWNVINLWRDTPQFNDETGHPLTRVDGVQSFRAWNNFRCVAVALYQRVPATPFRSYEFKAWARTWQSEGTFPDGQDPNAFDYFQVGIDPNGNTSITSGIVWARTFDVDNGAWLSVRATALSNFITVFILISNGVPDLGGTACQWPHTHVQVYADGATLVEVAP